MGLDRDALAAVRAELAATHSRKGVEFKLLEREVDTLLAYFDSHDMDVDSIPFDVDEGDPRSWEQEWQAYVEDAGLKGKAPAIRVVRFLQAREDSGGAAVAYNGRAKSVVTLLNSKGVTLSDTTISELERCLITAEAGDINDQSTCVEVIWLVYLGELPSETVCKWYKSQRAVMQKLGSLAPIEVRNQGEYKTCVKDSTTPVLERVLSSWTSTGYTQWMRYYQLTKNRLHGYGYPLAARRLEQVVGAAEEQFSTADNGKALIRKYLWSYFFEEFTGLGMPCDKGSKSWDRVMQPPKGSEAHLLMEERPTMAKEAAASPLSQLSGTHQHVLMQAQQLVSALGLAGSPGMSGGDGSQFNQHAVAQQMWLQQMQAASGQLPQAGFGPAMMQPQGLLMGGGGSGGGGRGALSPSAQILELDAPKTKRGPCELCGGAHDMVRECTKFREFFKDAKKSYQSEIAAKIAARKAAAAAKEE